MKEKKMFGKGEKRLARSTAECFSLSVWVTRFQPTDNGYIGLFWREREREGKIKLVCGGRKKNMMGKKKKEERLREIARGGRRRLLSSESRWIVSIHRRLAVLSTVESSL